MHSLPLFLDPASVRCLIVGGGEVALRKVRTLLDAGVESRVVAPTIQKELAELLEEQPIIAKEATHERAFSGQRSAFSLHSTRSEVVPEAKADLAFGVVEEFILCAFANVKVKAESQ